MFEEFPPDILNLFKIFKNSNLRLFPPVFVREAEFGELRFSALVQQKTATEILHVGHEEAIGQRQNALHVLVNLFMESNFVKDPFWRLNRKNKY